jgi:hypothetical protein
MNLERVTSIIDNRILSLFREGVSIDTTIEEIRNRSDKFFSVLEKDESLNLLAAILEPESITNTKLRYSAFYIIVASKRIDDLTWMYRNKHKFSRYNNAKLFTLIQLRDKISDNRQKEVVVT